MSRQERKPESAPRWPSVFYSSLKRYFIADERQQKHLLMFLLALVLTVIIVPKGGFIPDYYAPGDIAARDIKAPRDLLIPDLALTEKKRLEAEESVLPLYDFDPRTGHDIAERLVRAFQFLHSGTVKGVLRENLQKEAESDLGVSLTDRELKALSEVPSSSEALEQLRVSVGRALSATGTELTFSDVSALGASFYRVALLP